MRDAGIEAALGTDSLASNTSLDVLAEARALADRFPSVPKWELVKMATWNGARALGREDLGRLAPGARPGVYCVEGEVAGDPASFLLANLRAPRRLLARRVVPSAGPSATHGTAPLDEMRRVETFATEESTELASIARVGLFEDPPLVLGGEPPSLGLRRHFRRGA